MATLRSLINQIRFSLDNLGAQNRFHDFEAISRHVSRRRLGLNIVPATGPVSAGGDQGRDFETYTVLPEIRTAREAGGELVEDSAAFACTIQKDNIPSKIKSDVKSIIENGSKVDVVYFFSLNNVDIAKRHELQKWASDEYKIRLEIFDGEFLAENLADKDLFWIALEYLQIPSSLYPEVEDIDYLKTKEKWQNLVIDGPNYAVFDELRNLGRRCLFDKETKHDLLFWLSKLDQLLAFDAPSEFKRKVLYELVALRIRGTGTLSGWEKYVHQYFEIREGFNHQVEAQEACVVVMYALGSRVRGASDFTDEKLREWRRAIENYTDAELKKGYPKAIQAVVYELKGTLLINNPYNNTVNEGLDWWLKLAELLDETPLFPLERLSDLLTTIIEFIGDNPKFEKLTEIVDRHLEKRVGGFAAAEKCRDRALAYRNKGDFGRSLKELHKVKVGWYAHETLYGSLLSMLLIADTYSELGLMYAAKYYAAAVAFIAARAGEEKGKSFLPRGLSALAEYEYMNGEWAHFLEHTELTLQSLGAFSTGLDDKRMGKAYEKAFFYTSLVHVFTEMLDPETFKYVDGKVRGWDVDIINDLISIAKDSWGKQSSNAVLEKVKTEFKNYPFSDIGIQRKVSFKALGIVWNFYWTNGLFHTAKTEQLISIVQILIAESIHEELYLLKGEADVYVTFGESFEALNNSAADRFRWDVTLPERMPADKEETEHCHTQTFAIAIKIFAELSLLPNDRIVVLLESLFKDGLMGKMFSGNSYEIVFVDCVSKELYEEIIKLPQITYLAALPAERQIPKILEWKHSRLPEYSEEQSHRHIENRYKNSIVPIRLTLEELKQSEVFRQTVRRLRAQGWKDWHVLMASASIAVNYRINQTRSASFEEMRKRFTAEMSTPESPNSTPVPLVEFGETELRNHLMMSMASTLKGLGLALKSPTLTGDAVWEFLRERYRYFEDDIPHEDYFQIN